MIGPLKDVDLDIVTTSGTRPQLCGQFRPPQALDDDPPAASTP